MLCRVWGPNPPPSSLILPLTTATRAYNGVVANIPKVPRAEFEAVIKALLNAPPMPMSDIQRTREPKPKRAAKKKHG